jgi:flagellar biosynthesis chaperone FliJ
MAANEVLEAETDRLETELLEACEKANTANQLGQMLQDSQQQVEALNLQLGKGTELQQELHDRQQSCEMLEAEVKVLQQSLAQVCLPVVGRWSIKVSVRRVPHP